MWFYQYAIENWSKLSVAMILTTCTQDKSFVTNLLCQDINRPQLGSWIGCVAVDKSEDWMVSTWRLVWSYLYNFYNNSIRACEQALTFLKSQEGSNHDWKGQEGTSYELRGVEAEWTLFLFYSLSFFFELSLHLILDKRSCSLGMQLKHLWELGVAWYVRGIDMLCFCSLHCYLRSCTLCRSVGVVLLFLYGIWDLWHVQVF